MKTLTIYVCIAFSLCVLLFACKNDTTTPCTGKVKKFVDATGKVNYEKLSCTGKCPDGSKCTWLKTTNHHGGTREWCGCGTKEPTDECFIVFITPGEGEGGGEPHPICPPRDCPEGQICTLKEKLVIEGDGKKGFEITCECE